MRNLIILSLFAFFISCTLSKKTASIPSKAKQTETIASGKPQRPIVLAIKSRYLLRDSSFVRVFLEIEVENINKENYLQQLSENFRFNWLLQPDYGLRERLASGKVDLDKQNCHFQDNKISIRFEIPRLKNLPKALLLTEIYDVIETKKSNNDLSIDFNGERLNDRFGIFTDNGDIPIFRGYLNKKDTFKIQSVEKHPRELFLLHYKNDFSPAQAPMSTNIRAGIERGMSHEKTIKIQSNQQLQLPDEGLYLVVEDTNQLKQGFVILSVDNRFPKLTQPDLLIKPIVYMSSTQEMRSIMENENAKLALDKFFLTLSNGNQATAKQIIKNYYRRIEESNRLFTTYKEGWKTDKGMIYTILGPPNRVQRGRDREVWVYSQNLNFSEIIFTFNKKSNQFTDNYYELVRYPEYQAYWYPFVEAWRTGKVVD